MSDSLAAELTIIRTRLLTFVPLVGATLAARLGTASGSGSDGKLYLMEPPETSPDDSFYPFGVIKPYTVGITRDDGRFSRQRACEVQLFHKPREMEIEVQAMGDVIEQAWRHWLSVGDGIVYAIGLPDRLAAQT